MNDDVAALLTKAMNRLALVNEKRLAFEQEQAALRERAAEAQTVGLKRVNGFVLPDELVDEVARRLYSGRKT